MVAPTPRCRKARHAVLWRLSKDSRGPKVDVSVTRTPLTFARCTLLRMAWRANRLCDLHFADGRWLHGARASNIVDGVSLVRTARADEEHWSKMQHSSATG